MARHPRPAGDFCFRPFRFVRAGHFAHPHHLAHRPAHRGRSAPGGTLGRNLPGRRVSSTRHRRRRSSPAFERLRSVPGRKDEAIMRDVSGVWKKIARSFLRARHPCNEAGFPRPQVFIASSWKSLEKALPLPPAATFRLVGLRLGFPVRRRRRNDGRGRPAACRLAAGGAVLGSRFSRCGRLGSGSFGCEASG